jgi:hypothetical protein
MSVKTYTEEIAKITSGNTIYNDNYPQWRYLLESYLGGDDYRKAGHLTRYQLETDREYQARLRNTPLDNHCASVISVYNSFMFREHPERDFSNNTQTFELEMFLRDADHDGRSLDSFFKDVCTWSSVFGNCWIVIAKPNVGALTRAEEQAQAVRPYVNLLTPMVVLDWKYSRRANGAYELVYFKYIEEINGNTQTVKEWTKDIIMTTEVDLERGQINAVLEEANGLGRIPAVCAYSQRSLVRGLGVSDINDIADWQRALYNFASEADQSVRLDSHPSLVKTPETEAGVGAGAIIHMPDNLDPGLKPYVLDFAGASVDKILALMKHGVDAIDKMANTGAVRATESRTLSGVAMETEFQLLNARLSEKADNLELAEEQMWDIWFAYQGEQWMGAVDYPGSFNIRDTGSEIAQLQSAKNTATDPVVLRKIDEHILEWMGEEKSDLPFIDPNPQPGRTYPDGEEINANLPNAYQPASNPEVPEGQNCANCEYYKPGELYCTKFDAPVRAVYWCAKWEPYEEETVV